jgi:hypothetical protein
VPTLDLLRTADFWRPFGETVSNLNAPRPAVNDRRNAVTVLKNR